MRLRKNETSAKSFPENETSEKWAVLKPTLRQFNDKITVMVVISIIFLTKLAHS